jgi:tetratricopeptide (TPR) repeat protein
MRVAIYAIALNEVRHVERFVRSGQGADAIVVADTGSTDGTVEALRGAGATVHSISITPWRFDDARNASLALVPDDIDLCIALDLDEILNPGWRAALDSEWRVGSNRGRYLYAWSHRADGTPLVEFWSDKIHSRHGWRWRHPCHEALYPDRIKSRQQNLRGLRVDHWPDSRKRRSYLPLLEAAVAEDPRDSRSAFYLGREYFITNRFEEAEKELQRYLSLPGATWSAQNSSAMRYIGISHKKRGNLARAIDWFSSATRMDPANRDAWTALVEALHASARWAECLTAAEQTISMDTAPRSSANDPRVTADMLYQYAAESALHLGQDRLAMQYAETARGLLTDKARLFPSLRDILDPAHTSFESR